MTSRRPHNGGIMSERGFILPASYRVVPQPGGGSMPVVHLDGRFEEGRNFLVRDDRQRPHFYIREADVDRAMALRAPKPKVCGKRTFSGAPVALVEMEVPGDVPALRDRLHDQG